MSGWQVGGYTEVRELGRGASGRVVLAVHDETGTSVAIKYLDEGDRAGFRAEARLLSEIENPHVVSLYEYVEKASGSAIVMELVDGVPLRAMLREHGPTQPEAALTVLKGSLLGLVAAHAQGVVHRDYKPENVLVDAHGQSKLADFGIAARSSREGIPAGTPSYMPPEQWTGALASPQADIYAATAVFFECLTGKPPFAAPGDLVMLQKQHEHAPVPADAAPAPVRPLIRRGLAKNPKDRPADATAFLAELEDLARKSYGAGWEDKGRQQLARRALALALLFPMGGATPGATALALTRLGPWLRGATMITAIAVIAGGGGYIATHPIKPTGSGLPPAVTTSVSPAPEASATTPVPLPVVSVKPSLTKAPVILPPKLNVVAASSTANCIAAVYPVITVKNDGGKTLIWSTSATAPLDVSPAGGTLPPGGSVALSISNQHPGPTVSVSFTSNGGNKTITFTCV